MKFLFICGSLESGRDGVGDYVQHLCVELMNQGHEVLGIAINDRHIIKEYDGEQDFNGTMISVLRLPSILSETESFTKAKKYREAYQPDWISLQFVPYSFHNKGLPFNLNKMIKIVGRDQQWHVMFHELWLGFSINSPLKDRLIGWLQRKIIASIIHYMQPALITTSNLLYKKLLEENKISSQILPLFSNIPVASKDEAFIDGVYEQLGIDKNKLEEWRVLGIFGNIYPDSSLDNAIIEQLEIVKPLNIRIAFVGIGNLNSFGLNEFKRLENSFGDRIKFLHLGILPQHKISNILQMLDYGISCTPSEHIGKSGVFATMKLHGLKVILPKHDQERDVDEETLHYNDFFMKRPAYTWKVSYVTEHFIQLLTNKNIVNKNQ